MSALNPYSVLFCPPPSSVVPSYDAKRNIYTLFHTLQSIFLSAINTHLHSSPMKETELESSPPFCESVNGGSVFKSSFSQVTKLVGRGTPAPFLCLLSLSFSSAPSSDLVSPFFSFYFQFPFPSCSSPQTGINFVSCPNFSSV